MTLKHLFQNRGKKIFLGASEVSFLNVRELE